MLNSKAIGEKLTAARKNNHLSQAELALKVAISPQAVGKWERGESLPDITTLNRLAEILGVDLNYFSDSFSSGITSTLMEEESVPTQPAKVKGKTVHNWNWDMSDGNWVDADFSGLKNLKEKFSASNIRNCIFKSSDLSGLTLAKNNIELCDFSGSDFRNSKIQHSNLSENKFSECSLIDSLFTKSNIGLCNFSGSNCSGAEFLDGFFEKNDVSEVTWNQTVFKNMGISQVNFEGIIENCHFENCGFHSVKFQNATIRNTFFKYNRKFKKVQFVNCKVDKISYAFLKNNGADLEQLILTD